MPDTPNRSYSRFDSMTTEELRQILREDASKPEGEAADMEEILYVMEVLANRRAEQNEGRSPAEAWESFKQNYCTDKKNSLISDKTVAEHPKRSLWKRALVAAAVLALIIGGSVSAKAWDLDLWDIIVKWTQETFHFGYIGEDDASKAPTANMDLPCESLQATLDEYKITAKLVPTWLPEGYEEAEVEVQESPIQRRIFAYYQNGDAEIVIQIVDYLGEDPYWVEQDSSVDDRYISEGIEYYILNNYDRLQVIWVNGNYECRLSGNLSIEEIKTMIDSIGSN